MIKSDTKKQLMNLIAKHGFLSPIPSQQIDGALNILEKYILGEYHFIDGQALVIVNKSGKHTKALNLLDDVLPGLIFANRYFKNCLPSSLTKKLLNTPQIEDTIFELKCIGVFLDKHQIIYEPKLKSGKVPDFKIIIDGYPNIYVECKSQSQENTEYIRKYNSVVNRIMEPLNESTFLKSAWANRYRTELFPSGYIHDAEAQEFFNNLGKFKYTDCIDSGKQVTKNMVLLCIPREEESKHKSTITTGSITVTDKPTQISHRNTHLMIHAWEGVEIQARRSKRKLLSEARKKLNNIPKNSVGMICVQTFGALRFLPDIERLVSQKQYNQIPLVWLCPFHEGKIICRNEFVSLRNVLFNTGIPGAHNLIIQ